MHSNAVNPFVALLLTRTYSTSRLFANDFAIIV